MGIVDLLQGLLLVQELGYHNIIIEVDCKPVVNDLMGCNSKNTDQQIIPFMCR